MKTWILAARPKTLSAAVVPILVSTAIVKAVSEMSLRWDLCLWALLASFFIQIGTNLVNDASDFRSGKDTPDRLGPLRVTASGWLDGRRVMAGAALFFFLALLCGIPLVQSGGWPLLAIGLASIAAGYAYTAGPYPLAYHGLGEIFVIFFFGFVAVAGMVFVQLGRLPGLVWVAGLQTGLLCSLLLAINNYRDIREDRGSGKRTLAARYGENFARAEIAGFLFLPYLLGIAYCLIDRSLWLTFALPWLSFPLAWKIFSYLRRSQPSRELNRYLALSSLTYLAFGLLLGLGLWLSRYEVL